MSETVNLFTWADDFAGALSLPPVFSADLPSPQQVPIGPVVMPTHLLHTDHKKETTDNEKQMYVCVYVLSVCVCVCVCDSERKSVD